MLTIQEYLFFKVMHVIDLKKIPVYSVTHKLSIIKSSYLIRSVI